MVLKRFCKLPYWSRALCSSRFNIFRPLTSSTQTGCQVFPLTVLLWLPPLDVSCLHVLKWKCACAKKRGIVWLHSVHDLYNLFPGCIFRLSKHMMYLFQVKKKERKKKRAWITFSQRTTKVETRIFLRKVVLEWLNPSLPDLLLDCLSHSHFDCTYRFCMIISPWIKRYDYGIARCRCLESALKCLVISFGFWCILLNLNPGLNSHSLYAPVSCGFLHFLSDTDYE